MVAGDVCRIAGLAAQFTPAGAIVGAATLSAAGLVGITPAAAASVASYSVRDAFAVLRTHYKPLLKGLAVPVCAFLVLKFSWVPFSGQLPLWAVFVFLFIGLAPLAWMGNVCMRVAMTGVAGSKAWTRRETFASLFLILIVSLFIPSWAIATVILKMIRNASQLHMSYVSVITGWAFSSALLLYLIARLLPLFPYLATGEKIHFRDIWSLSNGLCCVNRRHLY